MQKNIISGSQNINDKIGKENIYHNSNTINISEKDNLKQSLVLSCGLGCAMTYNILQTKYFNQNIQNTLKGYISLTNSKRSDEEDFQAWCSECEKVRIEYDGWNEESEKFAGIKLICENCYFELKNFNQQNIFD